MKTIHKLFCLYMVQILCLKLSQSKLLSTFILLQISCWSLALRKIEGKCFESVKSGCLKYDFSWSPEGKSETPRVTGCYLSLFFYINNYYFLIFFFSAPDQIPDRSYVISIEFLLFRHRHLSCQTFRVTQSEERGLY